MTQAAFGAIDLRGTVRANRANRERTSQMHPYLIERIASQRVTEMRQEATQHKPAAAAARREPRNPAEQVVISWARVKAVLQHALRAA
jgi:hypothetical protein